MEICTVLQLSLVTTARPRATIAADVSDLARTGGDEMYDVHARWRDICDRDCEVHIVIGNSVPVLPSLVR